MEKSRAQIAHNKAMLKFMEYWKKHITGFDFTVPSYRRHLLVDEVREKGLAICEVAWSHADIEKRKRGLMERLKNFFTGKFSKVSKYGALEIVGCGINDLVREDFFEDGVSINHQNIVCYSIAPTEELLKEREARR